MAAADSVPGVSGGTIAFVLGFYDKFITSLSSFVKGSREDRKESVVFLVKLGAGWLAGFICCVLLLGKVFDSHIYELCSLFMGLTVFAVPLVVIEEREAIEGHYQNIMFTALGMIVVAAIAYFNPAGETGGIRVDVSHLTWQLILYVFVAAMLAISAMVIPGISGSTLLLIFGLYLPVMDAVRSVLHFEFTYLPVIAVFGLGVVTGIVACIRLVKLGLEKQRSKMVYLILGLVIGSLYAIATGPASLDDPKPVMRIADFNMFYFFMGGLILAGLQLLRRMQTTGGNEDRQPVRTGREEMDHGQCDRYSGV